MSIINSDKLSNLNNYNQNWQKGIDFLGCSYPIISGAMSYISEHRLVSAVCEAGGFGVLSGSTYTTEDLSKEINKLRELTNKPFAVNLILLHPQIDELVQTCINLQVQYIVLAGGIPDKRLIEKLKHAGIKVISFAPSLIIAKKLVQYNIDALIIEGHEAGGHVGSSSTLILSQEILPYIKAVPVFVAGGIASGMMLSNFLNMGASGVQIGTLLVCTEECIAHPKFKEAFIKAKSRQAEVSIQIDKAFPVIPVRSIVNKGTAEFLKVQHESINKFYNNELTKEEAILKIEQYWAGSLRRAVIDGDIEYGSLMAGQSVGFVNKISKVEEVINRLVSEAKEYNTI